MYLIVSQIFYLICLFPWYFVWAVSMWALSDGLTLFSGILVSTTTLYPLALIICSILAWIYRVKKQRFATIINMVPLVWILGFTVLIMILN